MPRASFHEAELFNSATRLCRWRCAFAGWCPERHRRAAGVPILFSQRSTAVWIVIGLSVLAVAILGIVGRRPGSPSDLGWVTEQWLAEHRADRSASSR